MNFNEENMTSIPMCVMCGEHEVGTFTGSTMFCSEQCEDTAHEQDTHNSTDWDNYLSQYDDDPSPYDGTYSEE